ncbi:unnamed protein product, partial [Ectocarpus sp. 13 AM-2016]
VRGLDGGRQASPRERLPGSPPPLFVKVTVTVCDGPPSPRANFTVTSLPSGDM